MGDDDRMKLQVGPPVTSKHGRPLPITSNCPASNRTIIDTQATIWQAVRFQRNERLSWGAMHVPRTTVKLRSCKQLPNCANASLKMSQPITVVFVCPKCGAGYHATQTPCSEEANGSFCCQVCQTELYAWSGHYTYIGWQAIETTPEPDRKTGDRHREQEPSRRKA